MVGNSVVNANELRVITEQEGPLLTWLPLLSSSLKRFQPDSHCPQNQVTDLQVVKEKDKINVSIGSIDWDLNCQRPNAAQNPSLTLDKSQTTAQLDQFLRFLAHLPDTEIVVKAVNLRSARLQKKLSFNVHLNKTKQAVFIRLFNESGQLTVNVDLVKKDVNLTTEFKAEKFIQYIKLPEAYRELIKGSFTFNYSANLKKWEFGQFALKFSGNITPLAEKMVLNLAGEFNILTGLVSLQKMDLDLTKINYALTNKSLLRMPYVKLTLPQPARINLFDGINIKTLPVHLRIGGGAIQTKIEPVIKPAIRAKTQKFPPLFANIKTHGKINNLNIDWSLSLINSAIAGSLNYHSNILTANIKKGQLSAPVLIDGLQAYLPVMQNWSVDKGSINYQLNAKYNLQTKTGYLKSLLKGQDIAGQKGTILFDGLTFNSDTDFEVNSEKVHIKRGKQQLMLNNLFVGVPIQGVRIDAHSSAGITVIDDFNACLLGGEVTIENLKLQPQSSASINLSGLSLSEIIKYSAYPAISASGLLDGVLPLTLTSQGIDIDQGLVFARAPGGYIKVPQDDVVKKMASTQPAFAFTLQLLSNFQFDTLRGRIGYTAEGEMDINAEIHGMNPDVSGVQPVKFNYSHTENILKLLESLRFSDELTRQIQENY
ncbi:hypothetical protein CXF72_17875 [Psychromonas sp. MB-3u-54]|uniref:YdbH domain-containing protein n=1 Tax=Psychromonas sp. MB-3u-54 TaxID=2058319 RepID=UPI000C342A6E|nr:YdbH domain-containing protein [Psychromonas sp. MB-3u-54]PKH01280.1 hypothetical protein CXF72_17875 [Psychromonas sp. MB-3u-54]